MNTYDLGDRPRLAYAFTSQNIPADVTRLVFTMEPGDRSAPVTYTWLLAGGGDAQIVHDSVGNWHLDYVISVTGCFRYTWQAFDNLGVSLDGTSGQFWVTQV